MCIRDSTPTGAISAACFVRNRAGVVVAVLACAPWVVAGALATGGGTATAESAAAFALRDMMVLPDMALTRASLGFGDLPARNVPQDALLGLVPFPVLLVRVLVIGAATAAAVAGHRLGTHPLGKAAAMTVAVWNPLVIERLLQGQWSLAVAAWLIPLVALGGRAGPVAQWVASFTPTGAIAAACFVRDRAGVVVAVLACAPWVVAGAVSYTHLTLPTKA